MEREQQISFGDRVRVRPVKTTIDAGLAGRVGQVYGETTPSITGVNVIGDVTADYAINVNFETIEGEYWFPPDLLEFVDHAPGTEIAIGANRLLRAEDGTWIEEQPREKKPWWKIW